MENLCNCKFLNDDPAQLQCVRIKQGDIGMKVCSDCEQGADI
jgi:hypothetical protein